MVPPYGPYKGILNGNLTVKVSAKNSSASSLAKPAKRSDSNAKTGPASTVRRSEDVIRANAVETPSPQYPPVAYKTRVEGDVEIEITIDENGDVIDARAASGHVLLQQAALTTARQWKFRPTILDGKPLKVSGILTFRFKL